MKFSCSQVGRASIITLVLVALSVPLFSRAQTRGDRQARPNAGTVDAQDAVALLVGKETWTPRDPRFRPVARLILDLNNPGGDGPERGRVIGSRFIWKDASGGEIAAERLWKKGTAATAGAGDQLSEFTLAEYVKFMTLFDLPTASQMRGVTLDANSLQFRVDERSAGLSLKEIENLTQQRSKQLMERYKQAIVTLEKSGG